MPAACLNGKIRPGQVMDGCWARFKQSECYCTRETKQYLKISGNENIVYTHKGCVCNERLALANRHQVDDGTKFDDNVFESMRRHWPSNNVILDKISRQDVVNHYTGSKRARKMRAMESLRTQELSNDDARVRMFLKDDKYTNEKIKAPRAIQYRSDRYAIELARYTMPYEEVEFKREVNGHRVIAKGLTDIEIAQELEKMWSLFSDPVAVLLDHSAFDAHWRKQHQKCYEEAITKCYPNDRKLKWLLQMQHTNIGVSKNGTKFQTKYTIMSGDQDTSLKGCTGNYAMIDVAFEDIYHEKIVNGDDSVAIIERKDVGKIPMVLQRFRQMGQNTKCEIVDEFEHIEFCQCKPVLTFRGWRMVRDPARVLSRIGWMVKKNIPRHIYPAYAKGVFLGELALNQGVPLLGVLADRIVKSLPVKTYRGQLDVHEQLRRNKLDASHAKYVEVPMYTRLSYQNAFGMSISEQLEWESKEFWITDGTEHVPHELSWIVDS